MYEYIVCQGKSLQITLSLPCDRPEPLITVLAAFFYYHRRKALLEAPAVYQDGAKVLEAQVASEFEKLKMFFIQGENC